jgi:integrase/recombinase XerD
MMAKAYLEPNDVELIEKATTCLRDRLLVRILSHTGCRISEILGLTPEDLSFNEGTIRIVHLKVRQEIACPSCNARLSKNHSYCPRCGKPVALTISGAKEHRRMRTVPLDKTTLILLKQYCDQGGIVERNGRKLIFGINRHRAWQIIKGYADKAGLPQITNAESGKVHHVSPHKFRDYLAIQAMKKDDSGDSLRFLQQHLGHSSFSTTARYRKISDQEYRDWYDRLWSENES